MMDLLVDVLRTPEKYISWRWSSPVFFLTSCLIVVNEKSISFSIILLPMMTIIKIFWLLSALAIIYSTVAYAFRLGVKITESRQEKIRTSRAVEKLEAVIWKELTELTPRELSLLKYVYKFPADGVYIPYENSAGLSLLRKGILRLYSRMTVMRGIEYSDNPDQCLLYGITPYVREVLTSREGLMKWDAVRTDAGLDDYQ